MDIKTRLVACLHTWKDFRQPQYIWGIEIELVYTSIADATCYAGIIMAASVTK